MKKSLIIFGLLLVGCDGGVILAKAYALDVKVISSVTNAYCELPEAARMLNRARWNMAIKPNSIELHCAAK